MNDLRLAFRALRDQKTFAFAALITLAVGIGANTAIFSVVYGILVRPLPFQDPERLVQIYEEHPGGQPPIRQHQLSNLTIYNWRDSRTIGPIATYGDLAFTINFDVPSRMVGADTSPELFTVLNVRPAHGRFFTDSDVAPGAEPVVILTDALWREQFGGDPAVIGRMLTLNDRAHRIVGVAPMGVSFPTRAVRFWVTSGLAPPGTGDKVRMNMSHAIARLAPDATPAQAAAEGTAAARSMPRPFNAELLLGQGGPVEVRVHRIVEQMTSEIRPALLVLMASVCCLLLIACANVANLFLSRGVSREREFAVRVALGAGRGRLVRQLLTESVVVALLGGALGLGLAAALVRILPSVAPGEFPRLDAVRLDWRVFLFSALMSVTAGVLAGAVPALRAARPDLLPTLREAVGASASRRTTHLRRVLLVSEAALAVMLLVAAALLGRSLVRLIQTDPGYERSNVLTARMYLPGASAGRAESDAFLSELLPRIRATPGVVAAGAGNMAPLGESTFVHGFTLNVPGREPTMARGIAYWVTAGYAEALQLRLRAGRFIADADVTSSIQAMVVNEEFAHTFFGETNPVGMQFPSLLTRNATAEIVGVVGNVLKDGLDSIAQPEVYVPAGAHNYSIRREINLIVRTTGDPLTYATTLRRLVTELRPNAAVDNVTTLAAQVSGSVSQPRFAAAVLGSFATLAVMLAAVGLYGVLSYNVARRRRELGIRAALGAPRGRLIGMVLREGMTVAIIGLILGIAAAAVVTRLMQSLLFGIESLDLVSFVAGPAVLAIVAFLACLLPARRAAAIDPMIALRGD